MEVFWDDFSKVFGRISMLGLIVFKVLASSFWGRWWEISLFCCHRLEYDLGVVCTLFVILCMQFGTLAGFFVCLLSFQNSILTWLQRRIAVTFLNVLDVVKAAPQARPKTT